MKLLRLGVGPHDGRTLTEDHLHLLDVSDCHHVVTNSWAVLDREGKTFLSRPETVLDKQIIK